MSAKLAVVLIAALLLAVAGSTLKVEERCETTTGPGITGANGDVVGAGQRLTTCSWRIGWRY